MEITSLLDWKCPLALSILASLCFNFPADVLLCSLIYPMQLFEIVYFLCFTYSYLLKDIDKSKVT